MKKIYLHLGTHKTGTSFVQFALRTNQDVLATMGVRPVVGAESNLFLQGIDHDEIRSNWMKDECDVLVFSNENFVLADNPARLDLARELRDTAVRAGGDVTTVFYVRPAVEWLPSMWAQYVKIGSRTFGTLTLDEFIDEYRYESVLEALADLRKERETIIRPYVRSLMKNGSIFEDFFDIIGVETDRLDSDKEVNATPSRRQVELARVYNLNQLPGRAAREHHVQLLNSFLRERHYRDPSPTVASTVTKEQFQRMSDRYAEREAELTNGAVDSRHMLAKHLVRAPESYAPEVPDEAIDLYLQNMTILSTVERLSTFGSNDDRAGM